MDVSESCNTFTADCEGVRSGSMWTGLAGIEETRWNSFLPLMGGCIWSTCPPASRD